MSSIVAGYAGPGALVPPRATPLHYPTLVGAAEWRGLPAATRARLEAPHACFVGAMTLRASACGRWLARLCRLVGSPLPPSCATPVVATVEVAHDAATGGHRWTRSYALPTRTFTVESVKTVGPSGRVVERLAAGLRMEHDIYARDGELHFVSTGYFFEVPLRRLGELALGRLAELLVGSGRDTWRLRLPSWWPPGCTHVVHRDLGDGRFRFTMTIRHAWLGELFHHDGVFRLAGG